MIVFPGVLMQYAQPHLNVVELLDAASPSMRPSNDSADQLRWGAVPRSYRDAYRWIAKMIANTAIDAMFLKSMLTMIANSYLFTLRVEKESDHIQCLRLIAAKAKRKLLTLPTELHAAAEAAHVAHAIPAKWVVTGSNLTQQDYIPFLQPDMQDVAAQLVELYDERRQEALQELKVHNDPTRYCYGKCHKPLKHRPVVKTFLPTLPLPHLPGVFFHINTVKYWKCSN